MQSDTIVGHWAAMFIVALGIGILASPAAASTVMPMNIQTMADHAGQVIVGKVAAIRSYWADADTPRRRIESEVTFEDVEYLKGANDQAKAAFTLTIPGGTVGEFSMHVGCAPKFAVGDKWILFLLPTYKTFPVVGLYQGAFLVRPDEKGVERVFEVRDGAIQPVTGLDEGGFVQVKAPHAPNVDERLRGQSGLRVVTNTPGEEPAGALSYEDFVGQIQPALAASRNHHLTEPAGKRVLMQKRAVPLVPAATDAATQQEEGAGPAPVTRGAGQAKPIEQPSRETAPSR
ncbi:MAG: hypothetical protein JSV78_12975 [Phycisphaerales bacterium]|nr:MAG: hypothetical protein JSV78_12975 [Phycisphaerales bacterium]